MLARQKRFSLRLSLAAVLAPTTISPQPAMGQSVHDLKQSMQPLKWLFKQQRTFYSRDGNDLAMGVWNY